LLTVFDQSVQQHDAALFAEITAYRACGGEGMKPEDISELLVKMAPLVGTFVARLFNVSDVREQQIGNIRGEFDAVFVYRTEIVGTLNKLFKGQTIEGWDIAALRAQLDGLLTAADKQDLFRADPELAISQLGADLWRLSQQAEITDAGVAPFKDQLTGYDSTAALVAGLLDIVRRWSFAAQQDPELQAYVAKWLSFKIPEKTNLDNLVEHETVSPNGFDVWACDDHHHRRRDGFALTDKRFKQRQVLYEVDHCIYCHDRDNDSCSKGIKNKKTARSKPII